MDSSVARDSRNGSGAGMASRLDEWFKDDGVFRIGLYDPLEDDLRPIYVSRPFSKRDQYIRQLLYDLNEYLSLECELVAAVFREQ